jgi:predicted nucleotidyltransferase
MVLETLAQKIISIFEPFDPQKIILFGSLARKEWDDTSDVDLIIVYNTDKRFMERLRELYLSWDIPRAVDILAYTPGEFQRMTKECYFVQDVVKNGKVIYESP